MIRNPHDQPQRRVGCLRSATIVLIPLAAMLGACRNDDAPTPQALAPGTTVTTTTRTVTTSAPLQQQAAGNPQANIVQAPTDAVETPTPAPVAPPVATVVAPARTVTAPVVADATRVRRSDSRGRVVGIEPVLQQESPSGAGAVVGGLLGGVLGHQVGGGNGRNAATVLGVVGGAVAGNHVEKSRSSHVTGYRVSVRTEAGHVREFQRRDVGDLNVGAPVRIVNGGVQPT